MTETIGPEIGNLLDQRAPLRQPHRQRGGMRRGGDSQSRTADPLHRRRRQHPGAQQIAREAREEAAKARLLAERARRLAGMPPEPAQEPPF
jgi:hypothetical protein